MSILPTLPCRLPTTPIEDKTIPADAAESFQKRLEDLKLHDLADDSVWRDNYAFTSTLRTFYGDANILSVWSKLTTKRNIHKVRLEPKSPRIVRLGESAWIEAHYMFETTQPATTCRVVVSLVPIESHSWRIWNMRTILEQIEGFPNVDRLAPVDLQSSTSSIPNGMSHHGSHFDCVIVGAGQAGLSVGGRLKALGLTYVIIDKNKRVGDNWRLRYDSARLHTTRAYAYLPFDKTFPSDKYDRFLSKNELAQGYFDWAQKFDINLWLDTTIESGEWLADDDRWCLKVSHAGVQEDISASHIFLATGAGGQIPKIPTYPGREDFQGVIQHSVNYTSAHAFKDKKGIVIGTANTGHDVAEDMVHAGCASVTMVQRSPTYVFDTEYYAKVLDLMYNDQIPIELSDIAQMSNPLVVTRLMSNHVLHNCTRADPERYDKLESNGFKLIRYGDIIYQLFERFGGHYMDMGAVDMINKGLIKIKSNALPIHYSAHGLIFDDKEELEADVIVFATGFEGNTKDIVNQMFGSKIASQVDDFWGLDAEGEPRGCFKPTGHPALWMGGGSQGQARFFSRFVALSICAAVRGVPLEVYRD